MQGIQDGTLIVLLVKKKKKKSLIYCIAAKCAPPIPARAKQRFDCAP